MAAGDGKLHTIVDRRQTTDATVTTAITYTVPTDRSVFLEVRALARKSVNGYGFAYFRRYLINQGTVQASGTEEKLDPNTTGCAVSVTNSGADVLIQITGVAAQTYRWIVEARIIEVELNSPAG